MGPGKVRFRVYKHILVINNNEKISRQFIVLEREYGILQFTDFHRYIKSPANRIRKITDDGYTRTFFVVQFLNFAFLHRGVGKLDDVTADIVKDFLINYGKCSLPDDDENTLRSESTVRRCARTIFDFIDVFSHDSKGHCRIKSDDLYRKVTKRNKRGAACIVKEPDFDIFYHDNSRPIYRDIPNNAFFMLISHIVTHHKELLGVVMLSSFGGLRPSEACNVRRVDSPLGPGIIFGIVNGEVRKIEIDLRKEYTLRSDLKSVGNIKKERTQPIHINFIGPFVKLYNIYMAYLEGHKYEADYGPFSVNTRGKALTYERYRQMFHRIIKNEMIPLYLASEDPEIVLYGRILLENNLSPHVLRHWYTVQLVLSGVTNPGILMTLRGDGNPESALTYIQNKGELEKKYTKITEENFDFLLWAAKERHD